MLIIGELINCTRKRIGAAAEARDATVIADVARRQAQAGAHMIDVNGGLPGQEPETLRWLVEVVQDAVELPLCLDSSDPDAIAGALPLCRRTPLVSSITEEPDRFDRLLPLLLEHGAPVVALALGSEGTPTGVQDRVDNAARLVDRLTAAGVPLERIFADPCVVPI
ncbi:MAG TPA: dihydropteroate synthase, partial [Longimicrobiales bacterium]